MNQITDTARLDRQRAIAEAGTLKKGERIRIKPEWQDEGDGAFTWICVSDEDRGRVDISPTNTGLVIAPWQTVDSKMVERCAS